MTGPTVFHSRYMIYRSIFARRSHAIMTIVATLIQHFRRCVIDEGISEISGGMTD